MREMEFAPGQDNVQIDLPVRWWQAAKRFIISTNLKARMRTGGQLRPSGE